MEGSNDMIFNQTNKTMDFFGPKQSSEETLTNARKIISLAIRMNNQVEVLRQLHTFALYIPSENNTLKKRYRRLWKWYASHIHLVGVNTDKIDEIIFQAAGERIDINEGYATYELAILFRMLGCDEDYEELNHELVLKDTACGSKKQYFESCVSWFNDIDTWESPFLHNDYWERLISETECDVYQGIPEGDHRKEFNREMSDLSTHIIADKIKRHMQEAEKQAKLEGLIEYINKFFQSQKIRKENEFNIRSVFDGARIILEDNTIGNTKVIYTKIFKKLCNSHIWLPIEGKVTGIYLFERYGDANIWGQLEYKSQMFYDHDADYDYFGQSNRRRSEKGDSTTYQYKLAHTCNIYIGKNYKESLKEYLPQKLLHMIIHNKKRLVPYIKEDSRHSIYVCAEKYQECIKKEKAYLSRYDSPTIWFPSDFESWGKSMEYIEAKASAYEASHTKEANNEMQLTNLRKMIDARVSDEQCNQLLKEKLEAEINNKKQDMKWCYVKI